MDERIEIELALLRRYYPKVNYIENVQWVHLEDHPIPSDLPWNRKATDICFQVLPAYPGTPPYGFYVPAGMLCGGSPPESYTEPATNSPPFPGVWGLFSWTRETGWQPTADIHTGSNLLSFVTTFKDRFLEGR